MSKGETRPHRIWRGILARCHNPNSKDWPRYGARGITVCLKWRKSFANFWADMGTTYQDDLQIERINNNLGYFKKNCRWATSKENSRNKRNNRFISTPWGLMVVPEAAERTRLPIATIQARLQRRWPEDKLLVPQDTFRPINKRNKVLDTPWGRLPLYEVARLSGISESLLRYRLRTDWPRHRLFEKALRVSRHG